MIKYMCFNKRNCRIKQKMLNIIGLVVSINSSSRASFFGSLCYTTSPEKNIPAVKKSGNNLQRDASKK